MMMLSPDAEKLLNAISVIHKDASIVADDLAATVNQVISDIGPDAVMACVGKPVEWREGFVMGYAEAIKKGR